MADDTDGVLEATDEQLRIALTVASQFGERLARLREEAARNRQALAEQEHRELRNRFEAERGAARASLTVIDRPQWWDIATIVDVARVHEIAVTWRGHDDVAKTASGRIRDEIRSRYGIDVERPGAHPGSVADALRQAEIDRAEEREHRRRAGDELTASHALLGGAEKRDRDASEDERDPVDRPSETPSPQREVGTAPNSSALVYDSAERRREFAAALEGNVSEGDIRARLIADVANAQPAREAVIPGGDRRPRPVRRGHTSQRDRDGITR